jgi:hypothetical protein
MNANFKKVIDITTIAGASVLIINSALEMTKQKEMKKLIFPIVGIFVGVAALNYAVTNLNTLKADSLVDDSE